MSDSPSVCVDGDRLRVSEAVAVDTTRFNADVPRRNKDSRAAPPTLDVGEENAERRLFGGSPVRDKNGNRDWPGELSVAGCSPLSVLLRRLSLCEGAGAEFFGDEWAVVDEEYE